MIGNAQISCTDKQLNEAMEKACEHINKKLKQYFSTFIMSSIYGSYQAEKTLFKIAIEELGIKPQEAIFVDDSESNLDAAKEFGMAPILIDRYDIRDLKSKYPIIRSLNELT
ncbi:HAD family hydrolase [Clostridium algidicarnis]|nr:HAD-IA family hydrolase [Clostridium algidicarnis]